MRPHTPCAYLHGGPRTHSRRARSVAGGGLGDGEHVARAASALHMSELAERFHPAAFILRAAGSFGDSGRAEFGDDLRNGGGA